MKKVVLDAGLEKVDMIVHLADIHIRNVKRHTEYREVFERTYDRIRKLKQKHPNMLIYVGGDIAHAKTEMSPELVQMVTEFFEALITIAPTIVISGNHDCNLKNPSRLDVLTPISKPLQEKYPTRYFYMRDSGIYTIADIDFVVLSVFDDTDKYIKRDEFISDNKTVALYHGTVDGAQSFNGFVIHNDKVNMDTFSGYDAVLMGDIHRMQYLDPQKRIAYCGSLIQQNFGESSYKHGFLTWDMSTMESEFHEILNSYGFFTIKVDNGEIVYTQHGIVDKPRIRLKVKNTSNVDINRIIAKLNVLYDVVEIKIERDNTQFKEFFNKNKELISIRDMRDVENQNDLIIEFLKDAGINFESDPELADDIRALNRVLNTEVKDIAVGRNVVWKLKRFEFSNMFSYGEDNVVDFTNMQGSYGIFAPNASGKSSVLDALTFCCFDKCSRAFKASQIMNNKKDAFVCQLTFEMNGAEFVIRRESKRQGTNAPVSVSFYQTKPEFQDLGGEDRDSTNAIIRQYIGTYNDFIITSMSSQNDNTNFIDKSQKERKELLLQFLDLGVLDELYQLANENAKELKGVLREHRKKDYALELGEIQKSIIKKQEEREHATGLKEQMEVERSKLLADIDSVKAKRIAVQDDVEVVDVSSVKQRIQEAKATIESCELEKRKYTDLLEEVLTTLSKIDLKVSQAEASNLSEKLRELADARKAKSESENQLRLLEKEESHLRATIDRLSEHKYDPECEFCVNNVFVKDAKNAEKKLAELESQKPDIVDEIARLDAQIVSGAEHEEANKAYQGLLKAQSEANKLQSTYTKSISDTQSKIDSSTTAILRYELSIEKYLANQDAIEGNRKIDAEVGLLTDKLHQYDAKLKEFQKSLMDIVTSVAVLERNKEALIETVEMVNAKEREYKAYELYLKATHRDGISYKLISEVLPQIQDTVNAILAQLVEFRVMFETDGKYINAFIVRSDEDYWALEMTSGMERFVSSLAIRTALTAISSLPRPNFLALDEGFGVMDSDNLNNMTTLFDFLKSKFDFILTISHIEAMRDMMDSSIDIYRDGDFSKISFS